MTALVTAYCLCTACCGSNASTAANGKPPEVGVTVAAPRSIPFGTWVAIDIPGSPTIRRRVDDRTHRKWDGRFDVLLHDHAAARKFGIRRGTVRVISPPTENKLTRRPR